MSDATDAPDGGAEVMSGSEIDALLAAVSGEAAGTDAAVEGSGEERTRIRLYDFRRPAIAPPQALSRAAGVFGAQSAGIAAGLSWVLRRACDLALSSVDTLLMEEYLRCSPEREVFCLFALAGPPGAEDGLDVAVVALSGALAFTLVGAALGGDTSAIGKPDSAFPSETEREVLSVVADKVLRPSLSALLGGAGSLVPRPPAVVVGPAAFPRVEPAQSVFFGSYSMKAPIEAALVVLFPAETAGRMLEPPSRRAELSPSGASRLLWLSQEIRFPLGRRDLSEIVERRRIEVPAWSAGRRVGTEQ